MVRVAIIGAGGFVGQHLAPMLQAEGHEVRSLVRYGRRAPAGEVVRGHVCNQDAVRSALAGCSVVVHLASTFSDAQAEDVIEVGTQQVIAAAQEQKVERLIYLSCLGAQAASPSPFYRAKWRAEMMVRASGVPYTILLPSLILGKGDGVTAPLAGLIRQWPAVPVPGMGDQRQQPVDVEDLCRCIALAAGGQAANEMVTVGGPMFLTIRELIDLIAGQIGVRPHKLLVPEPLLPWLTRVLSGPTAQLYSGGRLAMWEQGVVASPGIVQRVFGFEPRSIVPRLAMYLA